MVELPLNECLSLDRYLLNGIRLRIVMNRTPARLCLMYPADDGPDITGYQVRIEDAHLRLCKLKINPAIIVAHNKRLNTATAKYPYIKRELRVCAPECIQLGQHYYGVLATVRAVSSIT